MPDKDNWKELFVRGQNALRGMGMYSSHFDMVLFAMNYMGVSYRKALRFYANFRDFEPGWLHNYLCYLIIKTGLIISPDELLTRLAEVKSED